MTRGAAGIEAEALEWMIRVQHAEFADWDALSEWMAADTRHAESFNRLTLLDDEIADVVRGIDRRPKAVVSVRGPAPRWGLLAAGLALVVVPAALWFARRTLDTASPASTISVATRPGEQREVRLADGTRIVVAGATRLSVDPAGRHARLDEGQATFDVAHDPTRRFAVKLGEATVTDVGTVFDLRRRGGLSAVAVAQGEVRVEGVGAPVELTVGRRLRFSGGKRKFDAIAPGAVTGWQQGRFTYADARVEDVVADLEQATGAKITVSPQVAGRRFAGTIVARGDAERSLHEVAPVMGLTASRSGDGWVLGPAHDARRR